MRQRTVSKDITICEIGLDKRDFLHTEHTVVIRVEGTTESFEARNDGLPMILRQMFLRRIIWRYHQLHQDVCSQNVRNAVSCSSRQTYLACHQI